MKSFFCLICSSQIYLDNKNMPSITKLQQLIENAWNNGFDLAGKQQLGGSIKNTAKWIGASDICAMFSCLRIKYFLN
jgi:zinc finger-containing ubiquitin peptidase 1